MFVWLRRAFDLVCALAGLALLILLGPWVLLTGAGSLVAQSNRSLDRHRRTTSVN